MAKELLTIDGLTIAFHNKNETFIAIQNVNFQMKEGEILGIVGESGSGKTLTAKAILGLLPENANVIQGTINYSGIDLVKQSEKKFEKIRGTEIAMIFQDSKMALDQIYTVGDQIVEAILTHKKMSGKEAKKQALHLLESVRIPNPSRVINSYPFELSGGMCQRVMIAIALSCSPNILIADEPTTALDVTVQSQILDLLKEIQNETNMGVLLITHDLGVIAEVADRVVVMYAGEIMEIASTKTIMENPKHPYTHGLIESMLKIDQDQEVLHCIDGVVPDIKSMPKGCKFSTRCPYVIEKCKQERPELLPFETGNHHKAACFRLHEISFDNKNGDKPEKGRG